MHFIKSTRFIISLGLWIGLQSGLFSQPAQWKYVRPTNTGLPGNYVQVIEIDRFGNKWTTGYEPFWSDGGVAVFDDEVWKVWANFDSPLPDERVYAIAFDHFDNKWIGTENGLAKFDGENWTIYNSSNTPMESNFIHRIAVDHDNNIWVTYRETGVNIGGVGKFDGTSWTVYTVNNSSLPVYTVGPLAVDQENNVWIGTNIGAVKFDGLNWIQFNTSNSGIPGNGISDIQIDGQNNKWFCTSGGIARYDDESWLVYNSQNSPLPSNGYLTSLAVEGDEFWVGSLSYFVAHFDGANWTVFPADNHVYDVAIDSSGNGWICGIGFLSKYDGTSWTTYNKYNTGLPDYFIDHLYVDPFNNKWFSGGNGGVAKFDGRIWTDYNKLNQGFHPWPFPWTTIGAGAMVDKFGNTWIAGHGTQGGVAKWENGGWLLWENSNAGVPLQFIDHIAADSAGNFWAGMDGLGASMYDGNDWTNYNPDNSPLPSGEVQAFYAQPDGAMWIGTFLGLAKYKGGNWTVYTTSNSGLPSNNVRDIARDSQGNLWIATPEGLVKSDTTEWIVYDTNNSGIVADNVSSVVVDNDNIVWAGAHNTQIWPYYGGVSRFDGQNWSNFTPDNSPLPHIQVERLALDRDGNLWISPMSEAVAVYNEDGVVITGIDEDDERIVDVPGNFRLYQNFPNPFNPTTTIRFALSRPGHVTLRVYDLSGRLVAKLIDGRKSAGEYSLVFDGGSIASGVYFYQLQAGHFVETKKMILIR